MSKFKESIFNFEIKVFKAKYHIIFTSDLVKSLKRNDLFQSFGRTFTSDEETVAFC